MVILDFFSQNFVSVESRAKQISFKDSFEKCADEWGKTIKVDAIKKSLSVDLRKDDKHLLSCLVSCTIESLHLVSIFFNIHSILISLKVSILNLKN